MSRHSIIARELFEKGYNCAQSVFAAFRDETGMDIETALTSSYPAEWAAGPLKYSTRSTLR